MMFLKVLLLSLDEHDQLCSSLVTLQVFSLTEGINHAAELLLFKNLQAKEHDKPDSFCQIDCVRTKIQVRYRMEV